MIGRQARPSQGGTVQASVLALWRSFNGQPYILLLLVTLIWGGHVVGGKLSVGEISPMVITFLRWIVCFGTMLVVVRPDMRSHWPALAARWRYILAMGGLGFTTFNALFYLSAHHTQGVNIAIIQGSTPIVVLVGAVLLFGGRIRFLQLLGIAMTILGVLVTATHGRIEVLLNVAFNKGDLFILIAAVLYAAFTLFLRYRPDVPALVFFTAVAAAAALTSIPFMITEVALGLAQWPTTPKAWLILLYVAWFPSLLGQIWYIRANELIGPARTSVFYNLVPVFGAVLSSLILGEAFSRYDVLALALVLGGIYLAERGKA